MELAAAHAELERLAGWAHLQQPQQPPGQPSHRRARSLLPGAQRPPAPTVPSQGEVTSPEDVSVTTESLGRPGATPQAEPGSAPAAETSRAERRARRRQRIGDASLAV